MILKTVYVVLVVQLPRDDERTDNEIAANIGDVVRVHTDLSVQTARGYPEA